METCPSVALIFGGNVANVIRDLRAQSSISIQQTAQGRGMRALAQDAFDTDPPLFNLDAVASGVRSMSDQDIDTQMWCTHSNEKKVRSKAENTEMAAR
eukprot:5498082-Pyramimonas_sp.AAC.1